MKYLWYGFLGLFSLGFLGAIITVCGFFYVLNYYGKDLPDYSQLRNYEPPIVTRLYAGDGNLLAEFAQEKRIFVPIEFIPDRVKNAFIAVEDKNFYDHSGVDLKAITRAALKYAKNKISGVNKRPQGASTITQQVAKNFFFSNDVNYERKIKEAILAYRMTKTMDKDHILELYLNQIYMGGGAYGVAAAAQYYFDKALNELDTAEAAYLAGLPKQPNNYHPVKNHDKALERRNHVIDRMEEDNYITQAEAEIARLKPLIMAEKRIDQEVDAPYFAEEVRRELKDIYGEDALYQGGLVVRTSVNPVYQDIAQRALREGLMDYDMRHGWRGAFQKLESLDDWRKQLSDMTKPQDLLDSWDMAVVLNVTDSKAVIGFKDKDQGMITLEDVKWARKSFDNGYELGKEISSVKQVLRIGDIIMVEEKSVSEDPESSDIKHYHLRQIPLIEGALIALDPHTGRVLAMQGGWNYEYGGDEFNRATQAKRQPGSAFKPFVYLAALDKGFTPATLVLDAPFVLEDETAGTWKPTNYSNEFYGPTPIRVGIEKSRNLMTVRLADFLGMDLVAKYSDHFGITDNMSPLLANSLGSAETTLLRLTTAYAMLVNGGKKITPTFFDRIQDRHGKTIFKHDKSECLRCGDMVKWEEQPAPDVPDNRAQIADPRTTFQIVSIMEGVVQRGTGVRLRELNRPLAGKTGTTNESRDAWFMGFSSDLVVGVFTGFDEPRSLGHRETGSSVALPIFKSFIKEALADDPPTPFRRPAGLRSVRINADTGARARSGDKRIIWEDFIIGTEPSDDMYILDEGGISLMSSYGMNYDYNEYYNNGGGGDAYDPNNPQQQPRTETSPNSVSTGTGGLY